MRTIEQIAEETLHCALSWEPGVRLLGNVQAVEIAALAAAAMAAVAIDRLTPAELDELAVECNTSDRSVRVTASSLLELIAAAREAERLREVLRSAVHAMQMSASALGNGGGVGHEIARLEDAAARAALAGKEDDHE